MRDGSDAIADWPILNALLNTAAGATWVSVHHGGGVGIGNSIHAGMVVVADGTDDAAERLERVLTTDPGTGVLRHADAGYDEALEAAREHGLRVPGRDRLERRSCRRSSSATSLRSSPRRGTLRRCAGAALGELRVIENGYVLCEAGRIRRSGRWRSSMRALPAELVELDGRGRAAVPGLVDCHTHACFARRPRRRVRAAGRGAGYEELHAAGGGILSTVRATRAAGEQRLAAAVERHRGWMLAHGTTTFEAKSGYGLDRDTELAQLRAVARRGRGPDLARRPRGPAGVPGRRRLPRLRARGGAARGRGSRRGGRRLPRARSVRRRAGAALPRGVPREPGSRFGSTPTSSPRRAASRWRSSWGRGASTTSRRPGRTGSVRSAASDVAAVLLPVAALYLGRPMPPAARWSTPARSSRSRPTSTRAAPSARACRSR